MWRVTAFVGANIVTAQTIWEGLWMTCVVQSTGQMQCKIYDSMLALSSDLQAARAMVIVSVVVGVFGALTAIMGGKCTNCMEDPTAKAKACVVAGVIFLISAFLVLIPVSWSAHTIIRDFYNPLVNAAQRRELGASLYLGLQIFGIFLAAVGFIGDIIICALPMWKVSAFIGSNIVTAQTYWEGLWMTCVQQSTGQLQCKIYDSMLNLPADLQAARALVIISLLVAVMGLLLATAGGQCTNCIEDEAAKIKVAIVAGVFFIVAGVLCLIPVSWSANEIIRNFYNPILMSGQKRELGASLFIGWGSAGLLLIGGALLCCQCKKHKEHGYSAKYSAPRSADSGGAYAARALVIISLLVAVMGLLLATAGGQCTNCIEDEAAKIKVAIVAGVFFIVAGVLCLIPVSWSANEIIRNFYNPILMSGQKRELGASLFIGWGSAGLLLIGGALLCCQCKKNKEHGYSAKYSAPRSAASGRAYV
ncbi:uncharacterized protein LOC130386513 isoform X2 [Gadus chalcogrammus]|uniref:uncharacterized protein LOC130386513 isoform X2 n=1 Tax=Gadus chalcogrammus TaxID=1042646 RepID=UPI0024C4BF97|nr:uncharacterized protein LOC130386513 isoform X2 [Gadus chalcogrammus]